MRIPASSPFKSAPRAAAAAAAAAAVLLLAPFVSTSAHADPAPALDRISVWLGGFQTQFDGSVQLRSADGRLNTGEQPLFTGHDTVQRARLDWLLGDTQGFAVDYFKLHRNQSRQASTAFTLGGVNYAANAQLTSDVRADFGNIGYRWWLGSGDAVLGLGLGAGYYRLALDLQAQASATGNSSVSDRYSRDDHAWAPVLSIGTRWRVADGVRLYADASGVEFHNDNSRTQLGSAAVGVEWFPWHNVGVAAEYATTRVRYRRSDTDGDQGHINFDMRGPAVYLRMRY